MSQIENTTATTDISALNKFDLKSDLNDEIQQCITLREYIRKELDKILPAIFKRLITGGDYIQALIKIEQKCFQNLKLILEKEMNQYSISENLRKQLLNYAQIHIMSRMKAWEVSSIMATERTNMALTIRDLETELKQYLHEINAQQNIIDRSSAIVLFENIWIDYLSRMKAIFNHERQWTQMIKLIFEIYQVFYYDTFLSFEDAICYLPFLISRISFGMQISFHDNLVKIRNECLSKVQNTNPVDWHSNHSGYKTFDSKAFSHYQYINTETLNERWLEIVQPSTKINVNTESKYYEFCQQISSDWSLFINVFSYFEFITQRINEIFNERQNEETIFQIILIQEIIGVINTFIKDINLELSVFQLKISQALHNAFHICAIIFISSFYYDQQKTYFNEMIRSVEQNQQKLQNYFLFTAVPSELDGTDMANSFTVDFCNALLQSFNQQSKQMIEALLRKEQSNFNRELFRSQINDEVYNASDDWLIRYILKPMNILNEKIDQQWFKMEICIEPVFLESRTLHFQLFNEFFDNIEASISVLQLEHKSSSDSSINETLKNKQAFMMTLFYQYLSGDFIEGDSINQVNTYWQTIIQQWPKPSEELKKIFRSMKNQFEMYAINDIAKFLDTINQKRYETDNLFAESVSQSMKKTFQTIRNCLSVQVRGCTAQCPCCRRLCDADHQSNKAFAIGQDDNKHCCRFDHQIQGMADVHNALSYEAITTVCCGKLKDTDKIVYRNFNLQHSWLDVKTTHFDWDFTESSELQSQEKISAYIWNRIRQQLYQYYQIERKYPRDRSELVSNHFILLCGYSARSNSQNQSILQRVQQHLSTLYGFDTTQSARQNSVLWNHMPEILNNFLRIRSEKCTNDRITFITNSSNNVAVDRAVQLNEISKDQITQIFADYSQCADFSILFKKANQQLQEIYNDPKLSALQHTIIFIVCGDLSTFPYDELIHLHKNYHSLMKNVWTIALRDKKPDYAINLNNIMHGTLCIVNQWQDLHDVCLQISAKCDSQNSTSSIQQKIPTIELTDLINTSLASMTISEQNLYSNKIIIPSIPEKIIYDQICQITFPFKQQDILQTIAGEILSYDDNILIPLPNFSKRSIDYLPKIDIKLEIDRHQFNLKEFLKCFAQDIDVNENDLRVIEAVEGSIKMVIAPLTRVAFDAIKMNHINHILTSTNLPATKNFVALHIQKQKARSASSTSATNEIVAVLNNFNRNEVDRVRLTPETIDHSLHLSQLMTVLNKSQSQFLKEKSQQISNCLIHAFRECSFDFALEHALLVYNGTLANRYKKTYGRRPDNEKILFHGTKQENFDGIFQNNFQYNANVKRTDAGWYGRGIYFSSSPRKALSYAKSWNHDSIVYIICSIVALGRSLTVTNMRYKGKPMHSEYDSHYVRVSCEHGEPISKEGEPYYEEFVIKKSDRILPLFIVGIRRTYQCAIWRDLRINNEANNIILAELRSRLPFNIYESETSEHSLNILKSKFFEPNSRMRCAIITNGANEGQQFASHCRTFKPDIPIVVYCKNKVYHQQWAVTLGEPQISVTGNAEEVFQFMNNALILD